MKVTERNWCSLCLMYSNLAPLPPGTESEADQVCRRFAEISAHGEIHYRSVCGTVHTSMQCCSCKSLLMTCPLSLPTHWPPLSSSYSIQLPSFFHYLHYLIFFACFSLCTYLPSHSISCPCQVLLGLQYQSVRM